MSRLPTIAALIAICWFGMAATPAHSSDSGAPGGFDVADFDIGDFLNSLYGKMRGWTQDDTPQPFVPRPSRGVPGGVRG